ncbi:glycosyltransferase family 2 protein [Marinobacter sp. M5B]|uniref:glycosyltransferase family 2 protein n=1 Tax=Marinobacter sp. M5B TaxID=3141535 RepID=UPI0036D274DD
MKSKGKPPFFSVVIPVYNKESHIARSINSVLNQTFKDFELIVICDPSTDNSNGEVDKFDDPRIQVLYRDEPGPGGYAARNLGIKQAKSEWIAFLDADDEWYSNYLELAHERAKKFKTNIICFSYEVIGAKNHQDRLISACIDKDMVSSRVEVLNILKDKDVFHANVILIKKYVLEKIGSFPSGKKYKRGGDVDTWLRAVLAEENVLFCPEVTSFYNVENSGVISDKKNALSPQPVVDTVSEVLPSIEDEKLNKYLKKLSNRKSISRIYDLKLIGEFKLVELKKIYFSELELKQFLRMALITVLPVSVYDLCRNNLRFLYSVNCKKE